MKTAREILDSYFAQTEGRSKQIMRVWARNKYVITRRLKEKTYQDIADNLYLTRERIRQILRFVIASIVKEQPEEMKKEVEKLLKKELNIKIK